MDGVALHRVATAGLTSSHQHTAFAAVAADGHCCSSIACHSWLSFACPKHCAWWPEGNSFSFSTPQRSPSSLGIIQKVPKIRKFHHFCAKLGVSVLLSQHVFFLSARASLRASKGVIFIFGFFFESAWGGGVQRTLSVQTATFAPDFSLLTFRWAWGRYKIGRSSYFGGKIGIWGVSFPLSRSLYWTRPLPQAPAIAGHCLWESRSSAMFSTPPRPHTDPLGGYWPPRC